MSLIIYTLEEIIGGYKSLQVKEETVSLEIHISEDFGGIPTLKFIKSDGQNANRPYNLLHNLGMVIYHTLNLLDAHHDKQVVNFTEYKDIPVRLILNENYKQQIVAIGNRDKNQFVTFEDLFGVTDY
jgi:hypothetical protein